jgi:transposase
MLGINHALIWFYQKPVDFRKGINGLVLLIAGDLGKNPGSGELYIFRSKTADKVKIIFWDRNGFWLMYRKLEKGRFKFPKRQDKALEISKEQMQWLLTGLNIEQLELPPKLKTNNFHY